MAPESTSSKGGLSLYANLLDPSNSASAPGTISRAPVVFKQPEEDASQRGEASQKQQLSAGRSLTSPSLRFQPTKRPQITAQKAKAKAIASKFSQPGAATTAPAVSAKQSTPDNTETRPQPKTTLADWAATEDDDDVNGFYGTEKRQRGGRRKKRKRNAEREAVPQNWDDIYDPSRPSNYEEYKHSEEKIREVREWKDRLYAHRLARRHSSDMDSEEEDTRPQMSSQFAPPVMNFAPPPMDEFDEPPPPQPPPAVGIPDDPTGEDAYTRRLRMSQQAQLLSLPMPPPPPPPPPDSEPSPPPAAPPGQISRAPVRYNLPPPSSELPTSEAELEARFAEEENEGPEGEAEAPRSNRPGQQKFAERLLAKYGWTKGSGLGANASGIVNPLRVKVEKQKKKPDSEGGGFATPGGRGMIIGGEKKKDGEDEGKFGGMSEVIVLRGMLSGLDLESELQSEGGGIMQEIGEECGEKYGRVERVFIDRQGDDGGTVFVRFTSQLSALRAVNALEGRIFNGNAITARFCDKEKFEAGDYSG